MKKTFAILLSLVLVVTVVFAFVIGSSAAESPKVTSVTITDAEGATHVLDETITSYTAKTGTAIFNAASGELTLDNVSGVKKIDAKNGSLTIIVMGTNTIEFEDGSDIISLGSDLSDAVSNLLIKGDGTLNVKAKKYLFMVHAGSLEVTGNVTLNLESTAVETISDTLYIHSSGTDMIFSGNSVVNSVTAGCTGIRNAGTGSLIIRDNAQVTSSMKGPNVWSRSAVNCRNFKMTGGSLKVDMETKGLPSGTGTYACNAVAVSGSVDKPAKVEFLGGKVNIDLVGTVNTTTAFSALSVNTADAVTFKNTEFNTNVEFSGSDSGKTGVFNFVGVPGLTVTDCSVNVAAAKCGTLFCVAAVGDTKANAVFKLDFNDTTLNGECGQFLDVTTSTEQKHLFVSSINLDLDKSNVVDLALPRGVLNPDAKAIANISTNATFVSGADFNSTIALITGNPELELFTITITPPKGYDITLTPGKRTLTESEAALIDIPVDSIVYDPANAAVILNNMTGGVNRLWASGNVNYVLKGENTVTMKKHLGSYRAFGSSGNMTISGDGYLTISGGTNVLVCKDRLILEDNAKVKVISNKNSTNDYGIHLSGDGDNAMIVRGNAQLDVLTDVKGIYLAGGQPYLQITDNAKVNIAPIAEQFVGQAIYLCPDVDNGTGSQDAVVEVSGNASLKINNGASIGVEFGFVPKTDTKDKNGNVVEGIEVKQETSVNAIFDILDNAFVDITANNQAVYFNVNSEGDSAVLRIEDTANAKFSNIDTTNKGTQGAAVEMYSPKNVVSFTTTGTVDMSGNVGGNRATFYLRGMDYDVLVKDTVLNVSNVSASTITPNGDIAKAINFDGKGTGAFVVAGKAVVTVKAEKNGEEQGNRAWGLYLNSGHRMTIQDDAIVNATSGGDSKISLGSAVYLEKASILITDNGKLNALATGTSTAGLIFEGASSLTVEENGKVSIIGEGEGVAGVRPANRTAKGVIEVKDGSGMIEVFGDPAFNIKQKKITTECAILKAGDTKKNAKSVDSVTGTEGYVLLAAKNPPTSDLSIAIFIVVGFVAIATTAVVILRKRYSR